MESKSLGKLSKRNLWGYALGAIPAGLLSYVFTLKYIELFYDDLRLLITIKIKKKVKFLLEFFRNIIFIAPARVNFSLLVLVSPLLDRKTQTLQKHPKDNRHRVYLLQVSESPI